MTTQNHVIHAVRPSQSSLLAAIMVCLLATALLVALIL
jgi:hypothetical protein